MLKLLKFQVFGFQGHFFAFLVALAADNDDDPLGGGVCPDSPSLCNCRRARQHNKQEKHPSAAAYRHSAMLVEAYLCSVQMGSLDQAMHRDGLAQELISPASFTPPQKL